LNFAELQAIHSFLYEGMMSPGSRERFLEGGGFCRRHFWVAKQIEDSCWPAGGIGLAILCENLVSQAVKESADVLMQDQRSMLRPLPRRQQRGANHLPGHACIFCQCNAQRELSLVSELEALVEEPEWMKILQAAPLCFRHALFSLRNWKSHQNRGWLLEQLKSQQVQLATDLREFIRKHDYQCRNEPRGREENSVSRAIGFLVGLERQLVREGR
jgi:hypothetical protein